MLSRDGFEIVQHRRMTFDEHSKAFPTVFIREGRVNLYRCTLPYSHTDSKVVYFVTSAKGDEYGQFRTMGEALEAWTKAMQS